MWTRRSLLKTTGAGFGSLALHDLLAAESSTLSTPHHPPRADAVIFLFMYGGPSQVDTFDPKPALAQWADKPIPTFKKGDGFFDGETDARAFPSPYTFRPHGQSGLWISEKYPHVSRHADDLCVIRSMHADSNNHGPALSQMNSGFILQGYPSMGSWISYGLGNATRNLPSYVVLLDERGAPVNGNLNWSNGFMPAGYQGIPFRASGAPIVNLANPEGVSASRQRARFDLIREFSRDYADADPGASELEARIASYELAARMQSHAPEVTELSSEPRHVTQAYGLDQDTTANFGRNCLLARRLVERGVRFVQIYSGGNRGPEEAWDAHKNLVKNHDRQCAQTDQPIAALLQDLKQRGLLDRTLVVWGGEFGRLPTRQSGVGRDHNPFGFTMWLAGGGVKPGVHGQSDEFGYRAAEDKVHVHDLHATILHLLGLEHKRLTWRHQARDFRLTDVAGEVVRGIVSS